MNIKDIRCSLCGKKITPGNRKDGCPNGVGFQLEDGTLINACAECLEDEDRLEKWLDNHGYTAKEQEETAEEPEKDCYTRGLEKASEQYVFMMREMEKKLKEVLTEDEYKKFSEELAKKTWKWEVEQMPDGKFKQFCIDKMDEIMREDDGK